MGRPIAPRGASMLEMGKYGNEAPGAASGNCSDATASRQNLRAASVAAGKSWICHRDIVNLETRRRLARRHSMSAAWRQCHDSIQAAPPAFAGRSIPGFRLQSPRANVRRGIEKQQAIRRVNNPHGPIRTTCRPSHDGPGETPRSTKERAG